MPDRPHYAKVRDPFADEVDPASPWADPASPWAPTSSHPGAEPGFPGGTPERTHVLVETQVHVAPDPDRDCVTAAPLVFVCGTCGQQAAPPIGLTSRSPLESPLDPPAVLLSRTGWSHSRDFSQLCREFHLGHGERSAAPVITLAPATPTAFGLYLLDQSTVLAAAGRIGTRHGRTAARHCVVGPGNPWGATLHVAPPYFPVPDLSGTSGDGYSRTRLAVDAGIPPYFRDRTGERIADRYVVDRTGSTSEELADPGPIDSHVLADLDWGARALILAAACDVYCVAFHLAAVTAMRAHCR